jgi:hypothetical protein
MSLAETQELMRTMQELMALLNGVEQKTATLNADLPRTKDNLATFQQLERVAVRYLSLVRRMGLPDEAQKQIEFLSRIIVTIRMVQISYNMLVAGTPLGILSGIAGIAMAGMSLYDTMEGV